MAPKADVSLMKIKSHTFINTDSPKLSQGRYCLTYWPKQKQNKTKIKNTLLLHKIFIQTFSQGCLNQKKKRKKKLDLFWAEKHQIWTLQNDRFEKIMQPTEKYEIFHGNCFFFLRPH